MEVKVSDGRYQASTNVHIRLTDMNDNVPRFDDDVYSVYGVVEEDDSISTTNKRFLVQVSEA